MMGCAGSTSPSSISVTIVPASANVPVNQTQQFTVTVTGTANTAVTWAVVGGSANGIITQSGLYTAPATVPTPPQATVTATSQANALKSGSATVTITAGTASTLVITPSSPSVPNFGTQQFTASLNGSSNTAVSWSVNGVAQGNQQVGFITSGGLYVAPSGVPTTSNSSGDSVPTTVTVSAAAQGSNGASGSATVTVVPGNQAAESGPIELGTSGGNANDSSTSGRTITCCSGTLGALVANSSGTQYILSNNHVLARSDLGMKEIKGNPGNPGDDITQPGLVDTPQCSPTGARTVANLSDFYNLENGPSPKIDAAIAQVLPGAVDPAGNILYLGTSVDANGVPVPGAPHAGSGVSLMTPAPGMTVAKSGRATGLTCSSILSTTTNISVQYQKGCGTGTTFNVTFLSQVVISGGSFSAEGDSGSLIVGQSAADPLALLYGGSDSDSVGNPLADVLNYFASIGNALTVVGDPSRTGGVIGCTLPNKPASATATLATNAVSAAALQHAAAVRDAHAPELLAHPEVQAVGVGESYDNPHDPAIVLFVTKGQPRTSIPAAVDRVRTRLVEGELFAKRGIVSSEESKQLEQAAPSMNQVYSISATELQRAKAAHAAHAGELMQQPGVQGVGISSSLDAPGEAALLIFLVRGAQHNPIPPVIDGVRTRIRESSRFRAGRGNGPSSHACSASPAVKQIITQSSTAHPQKYR